MTINQSDLEFGNLNIVEYVFTSATVTASTTLNLNQSSFTKKPDGVTVNQFPNKFVLLQYKVFASASTDFDVLIYPDDDFTANTHLLKDETNNLVTDTVIFNNRGLVVFDEDNSNELHISLKNDDSGNASTFTVRLWGLVLDGDR